MEETSRICEAQKAYWQLSGCTQLLKSAGGREGHLPGSSSRFSSFYHVTCLKILTKDAESKCFVKEVDINQNTSVLEKTLAVKWGG